MSQAPSTIPTSGADGQTLAHGTAVAVAGKGVLIIGPSGSGKSGLALELMALGGTLIGDDRVCVQRSDARVVAFAPPVASGLIEARGVGILRAETSPPTRLALVVDMGTTENDRLPPLRTINLLSVSLPLVHKAASGHFAAAIMQYLKGGRES